jgi:uncharacterized repeat protein (TIGR03803 family)
MLGKRQPVTLRAVTLAVLSALLLIAARSAQAQGEAVLYNFCSKKNCIDGAGPDSRLTFDGAGNLYGTTINGGHALNGAVFELSPNGSGGWKETVIYSFCSHGFCAGEPLQSGVIFDNAGNLYGTAGGGANGDGAVFKLSRIGTLWKETTLYSFTGGADGSAPLNGLIMDPAGNLYGTTSNGGGGNGVVFELSPSGGGWTYQVIYSGADGYASLAMDAAGNIYGATFSTVFELSPNGNGGWNPTILHTFTGPPGDGSTADGTPVLDQAGNLYGTTRTGGVHNSGTVYKLSPGENGTWTEEILYSFRGTGCKTCAYDPFAGVVFDPAGNLYGTTLGGGKYGAGTVFELAAPVGAGSYTEKVLWSFNVTDGNYPLESLILDRAGNLYGTAGYGGLYNGGVVYEVNPSAAATMTTLTSSPNPSTYGKEVTFAAMVTPAPPDRERVTFMEGSTVLGTRSLTGGSATFTTLALPVGTSKITAVYGGDLNFEGSTSNKVNQVVTK